MHVLISGILLTFRSLGIALPLASMFSGSVLSVSTQMRSVVAMAIPATMSSSSAPAACSWEFRHLAASVFAIGEYEEKYLDQELRQTHLFSSYKWVILSSGVSSKTHQVGSRGRRGAARAARWVIRADDPLVVIVKRLYQDSGLSIHQSCTTLGDFQADLLPLLGAA